MRSSSAETIAFIDSPGGYGRWKAALFSAPDGLSARWNPLCCRVSGVYHRETLTLRSVDRSSRCSDHALPVVEVLRGRQQDPSSQDPASSEEHTSELQSLAY